MNQEFEIHHAITLPNEYLPDGGDITTVKLGSKAISIDVRNLDGADTSRAIIRAIQELRGQQ